MRVDYVSIGKRVKQLRKRRGVSQMELAETIDRSPSYVSCIENGTKSMSLETLVALSNALSSSPNELLVDSIDITTRMAQQSFSKLLSDCTEYEVRVLLEVTAAAKTSLRKNHTLFRPRY